MFKANEKLTGKKIAYSGSAQEFGSQHPRFVNYMNSQGTSRLPQTQSDSDLSSLPLLTLPPPLVAGAELAAARKLDVKAMFGPAKASSSSSSGEVHSSSSAAPFVWRAAKFPKFEINVVEVMKAVDQVLTQTKRLRDEAFGNDLE